MFGNTKKKIYTIERKSFVDSNLPVSAVYILNDPKKEFSREVKIYNLKAHQGFLKLLENTFSPIILDRGRYNRSFEFLNRMWDSRIPIRFLAYPRKMEILEEVERALLTAEGINDGKKDRTVKEEKGLFKAKTYQLRRRKKNY